MPTPEIDKALERQRKEAKRRRDRSKKTVDRIKAGRETSPGLAPLGDPEQVNREAMATEVKRLRRRSIWLVAFSMLLAAVALRHVQLISGDVYDLHAISGAEYTAFGAAIAAALLWARVVSTIRSLGFIAGCSPESVTDAARTQVMVLSAVTVLTSGLSVATLVWVSFLV